MKEERKEKNFEHKNKEMKRNEKDQSSSRTACRSSSATTRVTEMDGRGLKRKRDEVGAESEIRWDTGNICRVSVSGRSVHRFRSYNRLWLRLRSWGNGSSKTAPAGV